MPRPEPLSLPHTTLPLPSRLRQIDGLQMLRAVAVSLVAWAHATHIFFPPGTVEPPEFGVFGFDIFFVISGFILSSVVMRERRPPGVSTMVDFLKHRFIRIFPLYWLFAILGMVRLSLHHELFKRNYIPAFLLLPSFTHVLYAPLVGVSWTLNFEMVFYYVFALVLLKTVRWAVPWLVALLLLAVAAGTLMDIRRPVMAVLLNPILLEFVFGALLSLGYNRLQRSSGKTAVRVAGKLTTLMGIGMAACLWARPPAGAATGLQMVMWNVGIFHRVFTFGVAAVLIVGGVVLWSPSMSSRAGRLCVILGNSSYSAYLASEHVMDYGERLLRRFGQISSSAARQFLFEAAITTAVLAVGWVCYQFVEWPMTRWLRKRFLTQSAQSARTAAP